MQRKKKPIVIGNWKMNPGTLGAAKKLFLDVRADMQKHKDVVTVVVAPPFVYLGAIGQSAPSKHILLCAQDFHHEKSGAFTGEVSLSMLKSVGVSFVLVGHSERRRLGDSDEKISHNIAAGLSANMETVLCVGETARSREGDHFTVVEAQLLGALRHAPKSKLSHLYIAYEPVWAIGTGKNASGEDIEEMRLFIQKVLSDLFGRKHASAMPILYGGSVDKKNATSILVESAVDGFLVGGASLRAKDFTQIVALTKQHRYA